MNTTTMSRPHRSGGIHPVVLVAIGCGVAGVLLAAIGRPTDESATAVASQNMASDAPTNLSPEELYEHVALSVVTIIVNDKDGEPIGSGSGFAIDDAALSGRYAFLDFGRRFAKSRTEEGNPTQFGYVLTNYHVIRPAVFANIVLCNGDVGTVWSVIAENKSADLALLLVHFSSNQSLKGIPFAVNDPRVLATVYAIGSPEGLSGTASEGKVSAYRILTEGNRWLQTTAPISPGSSGGPLLSTEGTVVGVTTLFHREGQNLNFAIPISTVRTFIATTEFRPRDVAEGASISWHWQLAFAEMKVAITSSRYTDSQRNAIAKLEQMRKESSRESTDSRESIDRYRKMVDLAREANKSLPHEFEYLMHCLVGEAAVDAAIQSTSANRRTFTEEESNALYRDNTYAKLAIRHFKHATTLKPDFPCAYVWLYHCNAASGNWVDAGVAADSLVWLMPRCAEALDYRGHCYFKLNQFVAGVKDIQAAIDLSPKDAMMRYVFANELVEIGEYDKAIAQYEAAVNLFDDADALSHFVKLEAQYMMGEAYKKSGNFTKAVSAFSKAKNMGYIGEYCDQEINECRRLLP